jgi:uncharacterized membrane protein
VQGQGQTEGRTQRVIGRLLRAGVITAAGIALLGAIPFLLRFGSTSTDYGTFRGAVGLNTVADVVAEALHGHSAAIMQLGLVILILTPVARVAFSAVAFALERDRLYVALTAVVLGVLIFGLTGRLL